MRLAKTAAVDRTWSMSSKSQAFFKTCAGSAPRAAASARTPASRGAAGSLTIWRASCWGERSGGRGLECFDGGEVAGVVVAGDQDR